MRYLLAFLLLTTSCRPRCQVYHFVTGFPEELEEPAFTAAQKWSKFSNIPVYIDTGRSDDFACGIRIISKNSSEYVGLKLENKTDFLAITRRGETDDGCIDLVLDIWPQDGKDQARTTSVLMHEFFHEYGGEHVSDTKAVMGVPTQLEPHLDYNHSDWIECIRAGLHCPPR